MNKLTTPLMNFEQLWTRINKLTSTSTAGTTGGTDMSFTINYEDFDTTAVNFPITDDRWTELKDMCDDWHGTSVEKLVAIERFLATH